MEERQQAYADLLTLLIERVAHTELSLGSYRKALEAQCALWRRGNVSGYEAVSTAETANIARAAFIDASELMGEAAHAIRDFFDG